MGPFGEPRPPPTTRRPSAAAARTLHRRPRVAPAPAPSRASRGLGPRRAERPPVRRGRDARVRRQVAPQRRRRGETDLVRDAFHREIARFEQMARAAQPLLGEPAPRAQARLLLEAPREGTGAHRRVGGQLVQRQRPVEPSERPVPRRPRTGLARRGQRALHVLRLAAVPVGRHDAAAGDLVRDLGAVVPPHQVQAHVHAARRARRGQHVAVVDEEHVRVELDPGEEPLEVLGERPVRRGAAPVQEPGRRQQEGPRADGHEPRPGPHAGERGERRRVGVRPDGGERVRRDDHRVRPGEGLRAVPGGDGEVRVGPYGPAVHARREHLVPAARRAQDPVRDAELEGVDAVEREHDDLVGAGAGRRVQPEVRVTRHGTNVSGDDVPAMAPPPPVPPGSGHDDHGRPGEHHDARPAPDRPRHPRRAPPHRSPAPRPGTRAAPRRRARGRAQPHGLQAPLAAPLPAAPALHPRLGRLGDGRRDRLRRDPLPPRRRRVRDAPLSPRRRFPRRVRDRPRARLRREARRDRPRPGGGAAARRAHRLASPRRHRRPPRRAAGPRPRGGRWRRAPRRPTRQGARRARHRDRERTQARLPARARRRRLRRLPHGGLHRRGGALRRRARPDRRRDGDALRRRAAARGRARLPRAGRAGHPCRRGEGGGPRRHAARRARPRGDARARRARGGRPSARPRLRHLPARRGRPRARPGGDGPHDGQARPDRGVRGGTRGGGLVGGRPLTDGRPPRRTPSRRWVAPSADAVPPTGGPSAAPVSRTRSPPTPFRDLRHSRPVTWDAGLGHEAGPMVGAGQLGRIAETAGSRP
ncbi:putative zinc-binding oxidoreductase [Streptomyces sp. Tu6071]|nr:putative zinc-binding oxidoreductase [Streptomyces sp. Tu6071]